MGEQMRGKIKSSAATLLNSVFRMHLTRRRFIIMRNEYRARVAQRSRMIEKGGFVSEDSALDISDNSFERPSYFDFMSTQISVYRDEESVSSSKEFKWVMVDNRWVRADEEERDTAQDPGN